MHSDPAEKNIIVYYNRKNKKCTLNMQKIDRHLLMLHKNVMKIRKNYKYFYIFSNKLNIFYEEQQNLELFKSRIKYVKNYMYTKNKGSNNKIYYPQKKRRVHFKKFTKKKKNNAISTLKLSHNSCFGKTLYRSQYIKPLRGITKSSSNCTTKSNYTARSSNYTPRSLYTSTPRTSSDYRHNSDQHLYACNISPNHLSNEQNLFGIIYMYVFFMYIVFYFFVDAR